MRGGKACLAVAVDRKTRHICIRKMKNTIEMKRAILDISKEINEILSCESYLCRPYCSQDISRKS